MLSRTIFSFGLVFTVYACAASSEADPTRGANASAAQLEESCSTGPAYAPGHAFAAKTASTAPLPACVQHCGEPIHATSQGYPTTASLPSGSCTTEDAACTMGAEQLCACPAGELAQGPYSSFECTCTAGAWVCAVVSQGMSICSCDGKPFRP